MERTDTNLGDNEPGTDNALDDGPIVLRQLFDQQTHSGICSFLDDRVPTLSLGTPLMTDTSDFVRRYAHNVPFFVGIHQQLTEFASDLFGENVKPSYSFLSMYEDNGTCPLHLDRPQCRYTIDYLIRQTQVEPWPIHIGDEMTDEKRQQLETDERLRPTETESPAVIAFENWHEVRLNPNDAVCYSGTNSWHYRPTKLNGTADLVFFHFVPVSFDGTLD